MLCVCDKRHRLWPSKDVHEREHRAQCITFTRPHTNSKSDSKLKRKSTLLLWELIFRRIAFFVELTQIQHQSKIYENVIYLVHVQLSVVCGEMKLHLEDRGISKPPWKRKFKLNSMNKYRCMKRPHQTMSMSIRICCDICVCVSSRPREIQPKR